MLIVDSDVILAEFVAKSDDLCNLADGGKEYWVYLGELLQCFVDDYKLAFYGRTDQTAAAVISKVDFGHSILDGFARIQDIGQIGPGIPGYGPAS